VAPAEARRPASAVIISPLPWDLRRAGRAFSGWWRSTGPTSSLHPLPHVAEELLALSIADGPTLWCLAEVEHDDPPPSDHVPCVARDRPRSGGGLVVFMCLIDTSFVVSGFRVLTEPLPDRLRFVALMKVNTVGAEHSPRTSLLPPVTPEPSP